MYRVASFEERDGLKDLVLLLVWPEVATEEGGTRECWSARVDPEHCPLST